MSEFIRNLVSIARKDKSLAWSFIDENISRYDPKEVFRELVKYKHELDRDIFCYILVHLSLIIDIFSPNTLQILQIAHNLCKRYVNRIINAMKFNLVSRRRSAVPFELWELVGPRISYFLHELANNNINIDILLNEVPREIINHLKKVATSFASLMKGNEEIMLATLVLLWIFINKLGDNRFKKEWIDYFSTVVFQVNEEAFFILVIPILYLLDTKIVFDTILSEILKKPNYLRTLYNALLFCGLLEMNRIFPFSMFISNVVYIFSLNYDEVIRFLSIISRKDVFEMQKFISSKILRLLIDKLERLSHGNVERILSEIIKFAERYPDEFLKELMQFFRSMPLINDLMISFFIQIAEKSTEEKMVNAILREIMIKSKVTDLFKVIYQGRDLLKRLIMKASFTTLVEIARILRQLYISLPSDIKQKVENEYILIEEEKVYSLNEDGLRNVLVSFLNKL